MGARRASGRAEAGPGGGARDLKDFVAHGWRLDQVAPFDMFPHTPHIECVARLLPA